MESPLKKDQVCIRCGAHPLVAAKKGKEMKRPKPVVRFEVNGVGDQIAWCVCAKCGKVTPLNFE